MAKRPNDDLFESTTMSFGEHLEELRVALFKSLIGVVLGFFLGLAIANMVVKQIQGPLKRSLEDYYLEKAKLELQVKYDQHVPPEVMNAIVEQGLIPDELLLDIQGLVTGLRRSYPDQYAGLGFKPYTLASDDLTPRQWRDLARRLARRGPAAGPSPVDEASKSKASNKASNNKASRATASTVEAALWQLLDSDERVAVTGWGQPDSQSADGAAFSRMLNRVLESARLQDEVAFAKWLPQDEKQDEDEKSGTTGEGETPAGGNGLLPGEDMSPQDVQRRLNRRLLQQAFSEQIPPLTLALVRVPVWKPIAIRVQTLNAQEAFMIWLKAAFISGMVMASPWVFLQIWNFVAAGLYPHEKRYVYVYLPFSLVLFLSGAGMAFFFVFEPVLEFLFSFNRAMEIDPDPRISEWLSFVLFLPLGFGIAFQLPLVMLFAYRIGVVSVEMYISKWRIAILGIFVLSMLLTPADPISMLMLAMPLTVLYFLGVGLCKWMPRNRNPFADEVYEP